MYFEDILFSSKKYYRNAKFYGFREVQISEKYKHYLLLENKALFHTQKTLLVDRITLLLLCQSCVSFSKHIEPALLLLLAWWTNLNQGGRGKGGDHTGTYEGGLKQTNGHGPTQNVIKFSCCRSSTEGVGVEVAVGDGV